MYKRVNENFRQMKLLLAIILVTQMGCSFITTVAGSFVGNLGAGIVEEKMKEPKKEK